MGRTPTWKLVEEKAGACTLGLYLAQVDPYLDPLCSHCVDVGNGGGDTYLFVPAKAKVAGMREQRPGCKLEA